MGLDSPDHGIYQMGYPNGPDINNTK